MGSTFSLTKKLEKTLKKLESRQKALVTIFEQKRDLILQDPEVGYTLKGDLHQYKAYDWKLKGIDLRICYLYDEADDHIYFVWFGTRENFYEDVKQYLTSIKHRI
jgi:mRNA-degrading endonuclease RelE of RelBE toxin-antitoxin system